MNNKFPTLLIYLFTSSVLLASPSIANNKWNIDRCTQTCFQDSGYYANTFAEKAKSQLGHELRDGKLRKLIEQKGIKGTYIFDITIHGKGQVLTVYAYSDEDTNISSQNALKTLVKNVKFDLKIPENIRVKFNYTFHLY